MAINPGKEFEQQLQDSCKHFKDVFFYRIKDVNPMFIKPHCKVSQNNYDSFIYKQPYLFPCELKSTKQKSFSFSNSIIKDHQVKALTEANETNGLVPGFIFNFREYDNFTCFVHIDDFNKYKHIAQNEITEHTYKSKVNKASIGLDICKEIGTEIKNVKKKVKYRYYISALLDELIEKYKE